MSSLEILSQESLSHAYLVLAKDRRPLTVLVKGKLLVEATLEKDGVEFVLYADNGVSYYPVSAGVFPFEAFDEILEMVISFGEVDNAYKKL
jgi:hypothetical protein